MEELNNKTTSINLKSQILLPVIFVLTLIIGICFVAVKDFKQDLNEIVVWVFFIVCLAYSIMAIVDTYISKEKGPKLIKFIKVMAILSIVSSISFIVLYLVSK